jgi:hypothetical protein
MVTKIFDWITYESEYLIHDRQCGECLRYENIGHKDNSR